MLCAGRARGRVRIFQSQPCHHAGASSTRTAPTMIHSNVCCGAGGGCGASVMRSYERCCISWTLIKPRIGCQSQLFAGLMTCASCDSHPAACNCQQHGDGLRQLRNGLDRLAKPVLDLAPPEEKAALVRDPVFRRLPRKLAMPLADIAITTGAYCGGARIRATQ